LKSAFGFGSALMTVITSLLIGINSSLLIYAINQRRLQSHASKLSFGGLIATILGTGCASCSSIVLSAIGLSGAAALLPFRGQEITIFAIFLLIGSLYLISKDVVQKTCNSR
jgi:hypothetical protein